MKAKLVCEICRQVIGVLDTSKVHLPLTPEQFESFDPAHGFPPPFQEGQTAEFMVCFYCRHRPFIINEGDLQPKRLLIQFKNGKQKYFNLSILIIAATEPPSESIALCPECLPEKMPLLAEEGKSVCPIHGIIEPKTKEDHNVRIKTRERDPKDTKHCIGEGDQRPKGKRRPARKRTSKGRKKGRKTKAKKDA